MPNDQARMTINDQFPMTNENRFGHWSFGFDWSFGFGHWSFTHLLQPDFQPNPHVRFIAWFRQSFLVARIETVIEFVAENVTAGEGKVDPFFGLPANAQFSSAGIVDHPIVGLGKLVGMKRVLARGVLGKQ